MSGSKIPADAPPSYQDATGPSSSSSRPNNSTAQSSSSRLGASDGVPDAARRSMEDEHRPLPKGWVRTFDPQSQHQFFVDTRKDPPRSIWHHPYDDDEYLSTLSSDERERIEHESMGRGKQPSKADIMASHSDEDEEAHNHHYGSGNTAAELPPRPDGGKGKGKAKGFGRKLKDKLTGTTAEQREAERQRRAEEERKMYEQHQRVRQAMSRAAETGQPQLVGKDKDGKNVFVDPPNTTAGPAGFGTSAPGSGYNYSSPYQGYGPGMYSPYGYARPYGPYRRPYGGGYGGGYGLPLALGGGLLGGLLIGDALGGF